MSLNSGHWYLPSGEPFFEVKAKNGQMRPVTLRDARKVGAVPSVTTVLKIVAKGELLERWIIDQAILAALTVPRVQNELEESFLERVRQDAVAQVEAAADEGTRVHAAIERYFRHGQVDPKYVDTVLAVKDEIERLFPGVNDWELEQTFAHEDGYGGTIDLHSKKACITLDFKGKDGDVSDGSKRLAYEQHYQLAAYQRGKQIGRGLGVNLFFSRDVPGKVASHIWTEDDMDDGWEVFRCALALWQAVKKYKPGSQS